MKHSFYYFLTLFTLPAALLADVPTPPPAGPTPGSNAPASYQLLDLDFGGAQTKTDKWLGLYSFNYMQSYYGWAGNAIAASPWISSMKPNFPSSSSTVLFYKGTLENGQTPNGYPTTEGIYTLFTQTPFTIYEDSPLENLKSLSFQIYLTTGGSDDHNAYGVNGDLYRLPTLTLNTTQGEITLTDYYYTNLYKSVADPFGHSGGDVDETFNIYENYRLYQWDLSFITDPILSFWIDFEAFEHVSLRSLQLDQSLMIVPEPSTLLLLLSLFLLSLLLYRRFQLSLFSSI